MVTASAQVLDLPFVSTPAVPSSIRYEVSGSSLRRTIACSHHEWRSEVRRKEQMGSEDLADAFDSAWLRSTDWPEVVRPMGSLTVADLFCGSGGLSLGAWEAARAVQRSLRVALAVDNDEDAISVYRDNFHPEASFSSPIECLLKGELGSPTTVEERLLEKSMKSVDLLLAGPPCQGHSDLNNFTRRDDPRNALIMRVVRFAEIFQPRHIVIENVQGIRHDRSGAFQRAVRHLEILGYDTASFLLEGSDIGLPQRRRRCFLVGSRNGIADQARIVALNKSEARSFDWACRDLDGANSGSAFDTSAKVYPENQRRMEYLIENDLYELPDEERPDCHRLKDHSYASVYGRLRADAAAPTITTGFGSPGQGRYTHPRFARTITPHEAARLQFIPDFFDFKLEKRKRLQKLIGNAVPTKLAFAVVLDLLIHA